jgi:Tfp pilus assembly protein PilX
MTRFYQLRRDDGFAVTSAIMILLIIFMLGLAVLQTVDVQTHQTGHEIGGEASFNLADSALDAETDQLDNGWPSASSPWNQTCNQSSTPRTGCPGTNLTSSLSSQYAGVSFGSVVWSLNVVDDSSSSPNFYSDSLLTGPSYDANGDGRLWVRAQATIGGQTRIVVAQVVRTTHVIQLPHNVITSGGVYTSNAGNKTIIESTDKSSNQSPTGPIAIRCSVPTGGPSYGNACAGWDAGKGQLDPTSNFQGSYVDAGGGYSTLSQTALLELRNTAIAEGTYYNGVCPTSLDGVVYVDNPPGGGCTYRGGTWPTGTVIGPNGPTAGTPGVIVFGSGTLFFNGNIDYYGVIYMVNGQGTTPSSGPCTSTQQQAENEPVFEVHGTAQVWGAVFVDGCGQVDAGDSKANINFISSAFGGVQTITTPQLAKNTFRIIPNS